MAALKNFGPIKRGDTFGERVYQILKNDAPIDLTGAEINMQLRKREGLAVAFEFSTANNKIQIHLPLEGKFKTLQVEFDIEAYLYKYDLQIKLADGTVLTYIEGTFEIVNDITRSEA